MSLIFIEMLNFVKKPIDLDTELDRWLYALKHLTEFKKRPAYLSGPEFDQLFNLANYANLMKEERDMYNASLKRKWDNKNVLDHAVETATERERAKAEKEKAELRAKAEKEKKETAGVLKNKNVPIHIIMEATGLSIEEIEAL